jgi:hypothetical protein
MKWLLVVMLSNGSNVSLDTYPSKEVCESKAFPMRIEMTHRENGLKMCEIKFGLRYNVNHPYVVPADHESLFNCQRKVIQTYQKDERTNAICIPKG